MAQTTVIDKAKAQISERILADEQVLEARAEMIRLNSEAIVQAKKERAAKGIGPHDSFDPSQNYIAKTQQASAASDRFQSAAEAVGMTEFKELLARTTDKKEKAALSEPGAIDISNIAGDLGTQALNTAERMATGMMQADHMKAARPGEASATPAKAKPATKGPGKQEFHPHKSESITPPPTPTPAPKDKGGRDPVNPFAPRVISRLV